jgi:AcrR family transcriptional regulator
MSEQASYHHGNLRSALLLTALELLEKEGLAALSLRKVAAAVGVSHAAPAHHFPALRDLLTGLAGIGFSRLGHALRLARSGAETAGTSRREAIELAYAEFARGNPALFRLMFSGDALKADDPALRAGFDAIRKQFSEAARLDGLADSASEERHFSAMHGFAALAIDPLGGRALAR